MLRYPNEVTSSYADIPKYPDISRAVTSLPCEPTKRDSGRTGARAASENMLRSLGCFSMARPFAHFFAPSTCSILGYLSNWEVRVTWDNLVQVTPGYSKILGYLQVTRISQLLRYPNEVIARYSDIPTRLSQVTRISQNAQISEESLRHHRAGPQNATRAALVHAPLLKTCSDGSVVSLWTGRSLIFAPSTFSIWNI